MMHPHLPPPPQRHLRISGLSRLLGVEPFKTYLLLASISLLLLLGGPIPVTALQGWQSNKTLKKKRFVVPGFLVFFLMDLEKIF